MTPLVCTALHHRFAVEVEDPVTREFLERALSGLASDDPPDSTYVLTTDALVFEGEDVVRGTSPGHAVAMLLWHVNQETTRRTSPSLVLLHAAAAVKDGVGVVLPAPMEHGKTTTVTGLLRAGWSYVTDEAVAIDPETLLVHPFPKALSIDGGSWPLFPDLEPPVVMTHDQWQVPPSAVPAEVAAPVRPRLVVAPAYQAGAETRLVPVPRPEMLLTLAESCFEFVDRPDRNLPVLARFVDGLHCYRLEIGDLDEAVALVEGLAKEHA